MLLLQIKIVIIIKTSIDKSIIIINIVSSDPKTGLRYYPSLIFLSVVFDIET